MGILKTLLCLCIAVAGSSQPLSAFPDSTTDRALLFANCAGRYSAVMEHAWLEGGHDAQAESTRQQFIDLLEALQPLALDEGLTGPALLNARITAKFAQARMLQLATFERDAQARKRAAAGARRAMLQCNALVLS